MSDIPSFPSARELRSIANLSRRDGEGLLALAPTIPVETTVEAFPHGEANWASTGFAPGRSAARPSSFSTRLAAEVVARSRP